MLDGSEVCTRGRLSQLLSFTPVVGANGYVLWMTSVLGSFVGGLRSVTVSTVFLPKLRWPHLLGFATYQLFDLDP